jgi:hypothetical protein
MASQIIGERRDGSGSVKKGENFQLLFSETYNYLVLAESVEATREEILLDTPGLPIVGITQTNAGAICVSKSANRKAENARYWDVTCEFESQPEEQEQDEENPSDDPVTWKPKFKLNFEIKEKVLWKDKSDTPKKIVNSVNQRFETPLTEKKLITVIPFTQFEGVNLKIEDIIDRNDKVNKSSFLGKNAETFLLNVVGAEKGYFGRYPAWKVSYVLRYDPDTWDIEMLNVGTIYKDGTKYKAWLDDDGHRIVGNINTDGTKRPLTSEPVTKSFKIYERVEFDFIRV